MKKHLQIGLGIFCSLFVTVNVDAAEKAHPLDRIVAVANDVIVTQSELDEAINTAKKQLTASNTPVPQSGTLRKQVLNQLIDKKLQLQLADQNGITITDTDVTKAIEHIAASNKLTTSELYQKLTQENLNVQDYRKEIHDQMVLQRIQQQALGTKITVLPQEVDDFMRSPAWKANHSKEYHLEDILIALPEAPTTEEVTAAKKRADDLLTKLRHGTSFREAAATESGTANALEGGDLGWRKLPEIPSAFANALPRAKEKELLGPIQTPNGFHIIRVAGIRETGSAAEERKEVEALIYERKYQQAVQTWLTKLRGEAFINTHPDTYV